MKQILNLKKWSLLLLLNVPAFAGCETECDHEVCGKYSLEKAYECVALCTGSNTDHGEAVVKNCQNRIDLLMRMRPEPKKPSVEEAWLSDYPEKCLHAERYNAVEDLVPVEGVVDYINNKWVFKTFVHGTREPANDMDLQISPNVGEIGSGRGNLETPLLSRTPGLQPGKTYAPIVAAHVKWNYRDPKQSVVMCLSQPYGDK